MILLQAYSGSAPLIMFGLMFVVMYFFMIRPQIKKQKAENQYRASLKMNDKVVTIGGIHGKIIELGKSSVVIEVHGGSKLKVLKSAVSMSGDTDLANKK
jgi:preprotein translocase subunit YajC